MDRWNPDKLGGYTGDDWPNPLEDFENWLNSLGKPKKPKKPKKEKKTGLAEDIATLDQRMKYEAEQNESGEGRRRNFSSGATSFRREYSEEEEAVTEEERAAIKESVVKGEERGYKRDYYIDGSVPMQTMEGEPSGLIRDNLKTKSPEAEKIQEGIYYLAKDLGIDVPKDKKEFVDGYWHENSRDKMFEVLEKAKKEGKLKRGEPTGKLDKQGIDAINELFQNLGYDAQVFTEYSSKPWMRAR